MMQHDLDGKRPNGLLIVDKPVGPTSHDVVERVREILNERRVGHTGTLDPMATGVLVLCVGTATRLAEYLTAHRKRYRATVRFGTTTDTYDAQGTEVATSELRPSTDELSAALEHFRGEIEQAPPAYSALKQEGRRAHELARLGKEVKLEKRPVVIHELSLLGATRDEAELDILCSKGTYIRSIAHDLGAMLGCGAHLSALRRSECGHFSETAAIDVDTLAITPNPSQHLRSAGDGLVNWRRVDVTPYEASRLVRGQAINVAPHLNPTPLCRAYDSHGMFFAVLNYDAHLGILRPHKVILPPTEQH